MDYSIEDTKRIVCKVFRDDYRNPSESGCHVWGSDMWLSTASFCEILDNLSYFGANYDEVEE